MVYFSEQDQCTDTNHRQATQMATNTKPLIEVADAAVLRDVDTPADLAAAEAAGAPDLARQPPR